MEHFQEDIKKWVNLDSQLKELNDKVRDIRGERNELSDNIMNFVDDNNLSSSTIKISDGKLKFTTNKQTSPLTLGFLEKCLMELFNSEEKVGKIMEHIKDKREVKYNSDIKRFYNN
tara:strand:+ start:1732 stop:2079 length:348 start_codon:yes stop_codon:yes gene_type:complete